MATDYSENDVSIGLKSQVSVEDPGTAFAVQLAKLPANVLPIIDIETSLVIGYRTPGSVWNVYDINGNYVTTEELPLERPLFDPIDLIGAFGAKFIMSSVLRNAGRAAGKIAINKALRLSTGTIAALRAVLAKFVIRGELKFTVTTAGHMAEKGRFVPVQILQMAIKYGKKAPDPDKVPGAFQYTIKMIRTFADKNGFTVTREYNLNVILREADNTILHFDYRP